MRMHTRSRRRISKGYSLALEILESRQLLSWAALPHGAVAAPPFVGPVQTSPANTVQTAAAKTASVTGKTTTQADTTPDDDSEYATSDNFVGPVQAATSAATNTSSSGTATDTYGTKDYAKYSSDYSYYAYDKSYGDYYQTPSSESAGALDAKPPTPAAETTPSTRPATPSAVATAPSTVLANKSNEAAPALASHPTFNPPSPAADATDRSSVKVPFSLAHHAGTARASNRRTDPVGVSPLDVAAPVLPGSHGARLLAGAVAIDLASLKGAVDSFFASLDELAHGIGAAPDLARWLLTGAMATGVFEFMRTKTQAAVKPRLGENDDGLWAPYPVLVLVPPEDLA